MPLYGVFCGMKMSLIAEDWWQLCSVCDSSQWYVGTEHHHPAEYLKTLDWPTTNSLNADITQPHVHNKHNTNLLFFFLDEEHHTDCSTGTKEFRFSLPGTKQQIDRMTHRWCLSSSMFWIISPFSLGSMLENNLQLVTEILEVGSSSFDGSLAGNRLQWLWCDAVTAAARPWVGQPGRSSLGWGTQSDLRGELRKMFFREIHRHWNNWPIQ